MADPLSLKVGLNIEVIASNHHLDDHENEAILTILRVIQASTEGPISEEDEDEVIYAGYGLLAKAKVNLGMDVEEALDWAENLDEVKFSFRDGMLTIHGEGEHPFTVQYDIGDA